jgi:hypothetical protein
MTRSRLDTIFPGIPAPFPELAGKFTDFGQNLQKLVRENEKFAAKFAEAGNFQFYEIPTFSQNSSCTALKHAASG